MSKLLDIIRNCTAAVAVLAFIGLTAVPARAAVLTTGCAAEASCSLAELASGASFSVGSQSYTGWSFEGAYGLWSDADFGATQSSVFVTPLEAAAGLAGFNISGSGIGEPADEDWVLSFGFNLASTTPLLAAGLEFPSSPGSSFSFALADLAGDGYVESAWGIPDFSFEELAVLVPGLSGLEVFTTLFIDFTDFLDVDQLFRSVVQAGPSGGPSGSVPEPASLLLALAGLAHIGAVRQRRPNPRLAALTRTASRP